jgi:hypothetical protein
MAIFCRTLAKIAENSDHNVDPLVAKAWCEFKLWPYGGVV